MEHPPNAFVASSDSGERQLQQCRWHEGVEFYDLYGVSTTNLRCLKDRSLYLLPLLSYRLKVFRE